MDRNSSAAAREAPPCGTSSGIDAMASVTRPRPKESLQEREVRLNRTRLMRHREEGNQDGSAYHRSGRPAAPKCPENAGDRKPLEDTAAPEVLAQ